MREDFKLGHYPRFIRGAIAKIEACDRQLRGVKLDADDKALLLDAITNLLVTVKSYS